MKKRSLASRLGLLFSSLVLGLVGAVGLALVASSPATAADVTSVVPDPMGGPLPILGTPTPFSPDDTVTLPPSALAGGTITMDQTMSFAIPTNLLVAASDFGATGYEVTSLSSEVDATDATPATETVSATDTPFFGTNAQALAGLPVELANATFTGGSDGTVTFTQDTMNVDASVLSGILDGTSLSFVMTAGQNETNAGVTTSVPPATLGTVAIGDYPSLQVIGVTSVAPADATADSSGYVPTAMASSGLPVSVTVDSASSSVCSIASGVVTYAAIGTCTLDFNQPGDATYGAAAEVQQSFTVAGATQAITITESAPADAIVGTSSSVPTATASSGLPVSVTVDPASSAVCSIASGSVIYSMIGTCTFDFNQAGNGTFPPATEVQQNVEVDGQNQTITITTAGPADAIAGNASSIPTATASSGLPVSVTVDPSATSICSIGSGSLSFLGAGTCLIDFNQAGDAEFAAAPQVQQSVAVSWGIRTGQTISVTSNPPAQPATGDIYTPVASATSNLPVVVSVDSTSQGCSAGAGVVTLFGPGTCVLDFNQPGNATYEPAAQVQQSFVIANILGPNGVADPMGGPLPLLGIPTPYASRDIVTLPSAVITGGTIAMNQQYVFSMPDNLSNDVSSFGATGITISGATDQIDGTDTAQADITVDAIDLPESSTMEQAISGIPLTMAEADFTASAPGTASFTQDSITVDATVDGGALSGTTFSFALTAGQDSANAGVTTPVPPAVLGTVPVTATALSQAITVTSTAPTLGMTDGGTYTPAATASSGLAVAITVDVSSAGCSMNSGVVSFTSPGTCVLDFNQAGNATYDPAAQVQQSFTVVVGPEPTQTITVTSTAPTLGRIGGGTYTPTASASSGLAVAITVDVSSTGCSMNSGVVSFTSPGTCVLDFNQAGNATYDPAAQVQQSIPVSGATLTPVGPIGGAGLAGVAGVGFVVAQRRRSRRFTKAS